MGKRWVIQAAGIRCTAEFEQSKGEWVVTAASASLARAASLEQAILLACGGLASAAEARTPAAAVERQWAALSAPGAGSSNGRALRS